MTGYSSWSLLDTDYATESFQYFLITMPKVCLIMKVLCYVRALDYLTKGFGVVDNWRGKPGAYNGHKRRSLFLSL